jgi:NAD(P)H-dependent FMN reductase
VYLKLLGFDQAPRKAQVTAHAAKLAHRKRYRQTFIRNPLPHEPKYEVGQQPRKTKLVARVNACGAIVLAFPQLKTLGIHDLPRDQASKLGARGT